MRKLFPSSSPFIIRYTYFWEVRFSHTRECAVTQLVRSQFGNPMSCTHGFFLPEGFLPSPFIPDDVSPGALFPSPPGRAGDGGGDGRSPLPSTMMPCSQTGQTRSVVRGEPPAGGYGGWGPSPTSRAWGETAPWRLVVTVSASVTPCFCPLGQARGHGTCWLPRNEGTWGCRVTGTLPRWALCCKCFHSPIFLSHFISRVTKEVEEKR